MGVGGLVAACVFGVAASLVAADPRAESISSRLVGIDCGEVGQSCPGNATCVALAPSCGNWKTCVCKLGFIATGHGCTRARNLRQSCNRNPRRGLMCSTPNSECRRGVCQCAPYYRMKGNHCVRKPNGIGHECKTDENCIFPLTCSDGTCQCTGKMQLDPENVCVTKSIGDICARDTDCGAVKHAQCATRRDRCRCQPGFVHRIHSVVAGPFNYSTKSVCIRNVFHIGLGQLCGDEANHVCEPGLTCLRCSGTGNEHVSMICADLSVSEVVGNTTRRTKPPTKRTTTPTARTDWTTEELEGRNATRIGPTRPLGPVAPNVHTLEPSSQTQTRQPQLIIVQSRACRAVTAGQLISVAFALTTIL